MRKLIKWKGLCENEHVQVMVVKEVPANGLDIFSKNVRRKYKSGIGILRNMRKSSNSS